MRILVLGYSQTGQLHDCAKIFLDAYEKAGAEVCHVAVQPQQPWPFPWAFVDFFRIFPECQRGPFPPVMPLPKTVYQGSWDLIVLCSQVWFLSPSLPTQALLDDPQVQRLLQSSPVLTFWACRNMWHEASLRLHKRLKGLGIECVGEVVLTDNSPPLASFVTTPRWLLTGRKEAFGPFPAAGVGPAEKERARDLGRALLKRCGLKPIGPIPRGVLAGLDPAPIDGRYLVPECVGGFFFRLWSAPLLLFPRKSVARGVGVCLFAFTLASSILFLLPVVLLGTLLARVVFSAPLKKRVKKLNWPNESAPHKLDENANVP